MSHKYCNLLKKYQIPMAKSSLKIVKNSGNPLSKIKMNPETKMFICETCQDVDIKEKAEFQFPMKFELVNHFLNFHNDENGTTTDKTFEICQWCLELFEDSGNFNSHINKCHNFGAQGIPRKLYKCHKCEETMSSLTRMREHCYREHEEDDYIPYK